MACQVAVGAEVVVAVAAAWLIRQQQLLLHPGCFEAGVGGQALPLTDGVVPQIFECLVDLTIHCLKKLTPAAERGLEIQRGAMGDRFQPAACEPWRWRASEPLLLDQVVNDGLAISLG